MSNAAEFTREGDTLHITGALVLAHLGDLPDALDSAGGDVKRIDLADVDRMDTIGVWVVHRFADRCGAEIAGLNEDQERLFEQVREADAPVAKPPRPKNAFIHMLQEVGEATATAGQTLLGLLGFMGATTIAFLKVLRHPSRFRFNATVHRFEVVGVSALAIIGLMSFLIGIVIAQQGAVQLRQFGAEVFTINLVGRITLRELGVLMTAIMVAGRSGSAFAAQIGTMRLTEEVDAMQTIGISPMEALVVPRIMAAVLMMPLLGFYAAGVAIVGGAFVGQFMLGIPFWTFLSRIQDVVPLHDLWVGLVKAPVFGLIVALAGCYHGMQVKGNSEEVGRRTTMAVVTGIFAVIVIDAFFAVFFTEVGWG